ncbi:MAG: cytochrome c maturation protein CcmE [Legionella sp.]|nr:MAG: cytochrome c maturation protein CcmE [Legionella sp.]
MTPQRQRKLVRILLAFLVLSLVAGLVLYALRQNISLFYTPTQIATGQAPLQHAIRVGGMVEKGSIERKANSLEVSFKITDYNKTIKVTYVGILPDLFKEGQGIVAEGQAVDSQQFQARQVLAKHDENYMPPEVRAALVKKEPT